MSQAEQDRRIDYVEFPVRDVAEAKQFFGTLFGWSFKDYGDDYASFFDGRLEGGLRRESEVAPGGALVVIYAVDLEEMMQRVRDAGGEIVGEMLEFPGGRRFHFTDPSGNTLAVWSDR